MKKKLFNTIRQAEKIAKKKIRIDTFKWLQAAAEDGFTNEKNKKDLKKIKIVPELLSLKGVPKISTNFFNKKINSPLILAPMGHQTQFSKNGEIETAGGLDKSKTVAFFSTQGRISLNDIRKKNKNLLLAWEIFPFGNKNWILNEIKIAEKNRCIAICLCLDAPVRSHRYLDRETNYDARKFGRRTNPISPDPTKALYYDWELVKFVKRNTKLPVIVKGILSISDAIKAIKKGADSIWISNHGGRMLNSGISGVDALISIKKKLMKKNIKIIVDGGVRSGSDIIKYLCLGADYVSIGRPAIYGLIAGKSLGVKQIFDILIQEMKTAMTNGGFKDLKSLKPDRLILD